mgnify:FL=1
MQVCEHIVLTQSRNVQESALRGRPTIDYPHEANFFILAFVCKMPPGRIGLRIRREREKEGTRKTRGKRGNAGTFY